MKKYYNLIGPYCVQAYMEDNGKVNVHATVGSTRKTGGYNWEMNLPKTYKEMVSKWISNGLEVTKKYLRLPEGLTFNIKESGNAIKELESILVDKIKLKKKLDFYKKIS